ncbi:glucosaminyl-phosphotidylinositol O-acyltransferase [Saccharomycopsis crataegensis]|uniref:GPI-anchored wall transfer protein n=1 Tax=Saccharomycopsis crataegensis TaxID=43959 RepID=A0AAV5QNP3_9ASCO|nr:glucosaminyl-phosphotidylinositol O-acyltransferase [Saccharomycopsis crataegensis]
MPGLADDLKIRKEQFVTGLTGGTVHDVYLVTSISLITYFSYCLLNTFTQIFTSKDKKSNLNVFTVVLDYLLNWLALLLSITTYSDNIISLIYGILIPVVTLTLTNKSSPSSSSSSSKNHTKRDGRPNISTIDKKKFLPKISYLTVYRSQMLVITSIAILAVDFQIFPRRFAKCETWGTSLMDLGVGSFVFSMGIVSARSSIWSKFNQKKNLSFTYELTGLVKKILFSFKDSFTVFCLGIGRLFLVKLLSYQEHVSEYGVHWNFFVTLSLLQPCKYILEFVFSMLRLNNFNVLIGLAISLAYEYLLKKDDNSYLQYLLDEERVTIFDQNKEGISSMIGYISIFLVGESIGGFLLPSIVTPFNLIKNSTQSEIEDFYSTKNKHSKLYLWIRSQLSRSSDGCLIIYTVFFDILALYCQSTSVFTQVSRRFANFQYVIFVIAYNLNFLVGFKLINKLFAYFNSEKKDANQNSYNHVPYSLEAINNNGLLFFLISNVSTGLVNMNINTLDASSLVGITTMIGYTLAINAVAEIFHYFKIYIKL